jgi:death-on-curing protein
MEPVFLSLDEVLEIHDQQIERYGGSRYSAMPLLSSQPWPRLRRLSAANSCAPPFQPWPRHTLFISARTTLFIDGNKGVGANAAITFLLMNNWEPTFEEDELAEVILCRASGGLSKPKLIEIFESRCKPLEDC